MTSIATLFASEEPEEHNKLLMCKDLDIQRKLSHLDGHKKMIKFC